VVLPGTSLAGNTFNGWFTSPVGGTLVTSPYTLSGNATLYAQWTQVNDTLTFNAEGGSSVASITAQDTTSVVLPGTSFAGNTFNGWFTSPVGGTLVTSPYTLSGNATLYAQWTQVNDTLTFNAEGGSSVASITAQDTTSVVLPGTSFAGNTFNGWFTSPVGGTLVTSPYTLSGNATLYAQWTQVNDTLTFNAEGGSSVASITAQDTTSVVLPGTSFAGNTFNGWFTSPVGGTLVTSPYTLSCNATLYAQWTQVNDTLTFNAEGGSSVASITAQDTTSVVLPGTSFAGNTFNGWFTSPVGGTLVTSPYTLSGNATLYAQWTQVNDTLTFNAEGGSSVASITAQDTTSVVLPGTSFAGNTFNGWFTSPVL